MAASSSGLSGSPDLTMAAERKTFRAEHSATSVRQGEWAKYWSRKQRSESSSADRPTTGVELSMPTKGAQRSTTAVLTEKGCAATVRTRWRTHRRAAMLGEIDWGRGDSAEMVWRGWQGKDWRVLAMES